ASKDSFAPVPSAASAEGTGAKLSFEASLKPSKFSLQPGKGLEIRAMTSSDLPAMRSLMEKTEGLAFRPEETTAALKRALKTNPGLSQVAFQDGKLVGGVFIGETGLRGMINHLAIAPESRGLGVGTQLVQTGLRALYEQTPVRRVYASVLSGNETAMKFWSTLGRNATGSDPTAEVSIFIFDLKSQPWLRPPY
ncbi:MAG TPA: GNAT family N-acetyltransferase, partial [Candidatus Melainabacteria bacterium]|nr:GNAT family N-acetyltransferase [Candidatus Melainabacteria bacterium]